MNKSQIRKKIIKIRELANKKNIKLNFEKINSIVLSTKGLKKNIGGYFPVNFEVDDLDILQNFHTKKYQISLPVIKRNFEMNFYKWKFNEPLKVNSFGIPEPSSKSLTYPDIILVPLVAFDKNLNRFDQVYAAAGHPNSIFKIDFLMLSNLTKGRVEDITE